MSATLPQEYILNPGPQQTVMCRGCWQPLVIGGRPTKRYSQLVMTMQTPEGAESTHELLLCRKCRADALGGKVPMAKIREWYAQDVHQMLVSHAKVRGSVSEQDTKAATWLAAHEPVALRRAEGDSVTALRAKGLL